jgi:calcium-dependent protein kinase
VLIKRKNFNESEAASIIKRMLNAINYCHKMGIVHRDLKPENVLLEDHHNFETLKICDWGTAVPYQKKRLHSMTGTAYYMAPEVIEGNYSKKCDIWSIGVIAFMLLSGKAPFYGRNNDEIFAMAKVPVVFPDKEWSNDKISQESRHFVEYLLTLSESKRPDAEKALAHPFIQYATDNSKVNKKITNQMFDNLLKFRTTNALKKAAFVYMSSQLVSKEERSELDIIFKRLDKNNDGWLTKLEIQDAFRQTKQRILESKQLEQMFAQIDINNSGRIDYSEFIAVALNSEQALCDDRLKHAFNNFDRDGSGQIT